MRVLARTPVRRTLLAVRATPNRQGSRDDKPLNFTPVPQQVVVAIVRAFNGLLNLLRGKGQK